MYIDFFWLKNHHKQEIILFIMLEQKKTGGLKKVGGEEITAGTADKISLEILL